MNSRRGGVGVGGTDLRRPMARMRLRAEFGGEARGRARWHSDLGERDLMADSAFRLVREEVDGAEEAKPLRVNEVVGGVVSELSTLGYSVELSKRDYDKQTTVVANPIALTRALRNLFINAATHGEHAQVSWCTDGQNVVVQIEDDGPGIPEEMIEHIFEPFFRVDAGRRKKHPGAGLGMAIAKEIIERLGGTITVENKTPKGFMQRVMIKAARK